MGVGIVSGEFQISTTKDMFNSSRVTRCWPKGRMLLLFRRLYK